MRGWTPECQRMSRTPLYRLSEESEPRPERGQRALEHGVFGSCHPDTSTVVQEAFVHASAIAHGRCRRFGPVLCRDAIERRHSTVRIVYELSEIRSVSTHRSSTLPPPGLRMKTRQRWNWPGEDCRVVPSTTIARMRMAGKITASPLRAGDARGSGKRPAPPLEAGLREARGKTVSTPLLRVGTSHRHGKFWPTPAGCAPRAFLPAARCGSAEAASRKISAYPPDRASAGFLRPGGPRPEDAKIWRNSALPEFSDSVADCPSPRLVYAIPGVHGPPEAWRHERFAVHHMRRPAGGDARFSPGEGQRGSFCRWSDSPKNLRRACNG
jgi:hypothetical protein